MEDIYKRGLAILNDMDDETFDLVLKTFSGFPISTSTIPMATHAGKHLGAKFPDPQDGIALFRLATDYAKSFVSNEFEAAEISNFIVSQLLPAFIAETSHPNFNSEKLEDRFTKLTSTRSLIGWAHAQWQGTKNQNTSSGFDITTDKRTLFDNRTGEYYGATIVHNLAVVYKTYTGEKENLLLVTLDEFDVDFLMELLEKAKKRIETLKQESEASKMPLYL